MLEEVEEFTGETFATLFEHRATLTDGGVRNCRVSPGAFRVIMGQTQAGQLPAGVVLLRRTRCTARFEVARVGVVLLRAPAAAAGTPTRPRASGRPCISITRA